MTDIHGDPAAETSDRVLSTRECWDFAADQLRQLVKSSPGHTPTYTANGRWVLEKDPWAPTWSGGFLAGSLWLLAEHTGDDWWRSQAERYTHLVEARKNDPDTHDIGFVVEPSWGRWYDLAPHPHARQVLIDAGRTMGARLQEHGGYLRTWVDPGSTFIDIMMNVGIIFRAATYSHDEQLWDIAMRHCRTSRRYLVRGDGSTAHEGWFDTTTGEFLRAATHQGWRSDSTWARGQAWAIYGFTVSYLHTHAEDLLDSACRTAAYYVDATPPGTIPPNDWCDPSPPQPWESSAGAIAAAGLLRLADALSGSESAGRFREHALATLRRLRTPQFIARDTPEWEGIIKHAIYHGSNRIGVDESVMFGDYYFLEALALADGATHDG